MACHVGGVSIATLLADTYDAPVDAQDEKGWTALHYAVAGNNVTVLSLLLDEFGADRQIRDHLRKRPLHLALFLKHGECASLLEDLKSKLARAAGEMHLF